MRNIQNPLELDKEDEKILEELDQLTEDQRLELLRLLHAERTLEYQIYSTREQWLWIPLTTCFAAALLALNATSPVVRVGVCFVTGIVATWIANRRHTGLLASYDALNIRHKWVVALTSSSSAKARMKVLGFDDRLQKPKRGGPLDEMHAKSFRYPLDALALVVWVWLALLSIALVSLFIK
jgi:hypothetical protein